MLRGELFVAKREKRNSYPKYYIVTSIKSHTSPHIFCFTPKIKKTKTIHPNFTDVYVARILQKCQQVCVESSKNSVFLKDQHRCSNIFGESEQLSRMGLLVFKIHGILSTIFSTIYILKWSTTNPPQHSFSPHSSSSSTTP